MRLTAQEMELFDAACVDGGNAAAQELLNVFAVQTSEEILLQLPSAPITLASVLVSYLFRAINHEHRRRTGCDLIYVDDAVA